VLSNELIKSTPLMPGWMGARNPFDISHQELDLAEGAKRFTQSTMSYISLKGLEVSIQEILKIGVDNIDNHAQKLKRYFLSHLNESNFQTFHQKNIPTSSHIVSIFDPKKNISRVAKLLSKNNIFCSIRNGYLRVSFAHYNNQSDIDKLLSILKED